MEVLRMYMKDKNHRITLRLNDEQFEFVRENAETLDVSPSDFLRMVINTTLVAYRKTSEKIGKVAKELTEEVSGRENDTTIQHDIL